MTIREAHRADLPRLLEIYNHYVIHTPVTFDIEPLTIEKRRAWFDRFDSEGPHRLFVSEHEGRVCGYASSQPFRAKHAYVRSIETSIYLEADARGSGQGSRLYDTLLKALEEDPLTHRAYGGITLPNEASLALHKRFGFSRIATYTEVGFKFDRYWDVAWFERPL